MVKVGGKSITDERRMVGVKFGMVSTGETGLVGSGDVVLFGSGADVYVDSVAGWWGVESAA